MLKILLVGINAKYIHSNPAVYSLAAYAKRRTAFEGQEKFEVEIAEYTINQRRDELIADLYRKKPDILAFSCYIWNWQMVQEVMSTFHKICPQVPIWLGGPEVSFTAREILREFSFVEGIIVGEGEETFYELCCFYTGGKKSDGKKEGLMLMDIPGIVTRDGKGSCRSLTNLNDIPFFYRDLEVFSNRILYYESSRGCPYRCSYCLSSIDKSFRIREMEKVKQELKFFLDNGVKQVKFIDRTFNANHMHAQEIWQYLLDNDNGITNFHFEVAADILQEEELELLAKMRPGLTQLEIGVQSTNKETLKEIRRPMDFEKVKRAVEKIREGGNIHQHLDLIAGLPKEDYESFKNSFNQVYALRPEQLQLGFLKVLKGSPMWERAEEYGIVYEDRPPYEVLYTRWLTFEEVLKLKRIEEVLEIYYNSGQFIYTISMLEQEFCDAFTLYERLAEYMESIGGLAVCSARSRRYELLLGFIQKIAKDREGMYRELLTFDLYLREKMKTRPEFCTSLQERKDIFREIYRHEEENRKLLPAYKEYNSRQLAKMTHLEYVQYSVWERGKCVKLESPALILFDYQYKNPLTAEAAFHII